MLKICKLIGVLVLVILVLLSGVAAAAVQPVLSPQGAASLNSCQTSSQCRAGGCGDKICANKSAFSSRDSIFQSLLSTCLDGFTPKEKGMECVCASNTCKWRNDPQEEEAITQTAVEFMRAHYSPLCDESTKVLNIKKLGRNYALALVRCDCGMECGYICTFDVEKENGKWKVLRKEYKCEVR